MEENRGFIYLPKTRQESKEVERSSTHDHNTGTEGTRGGDHDEHDDENVVSSPLSYILKFLSYSSLEAASNREIRHNDAP